MARSLVAHSQLLKTSTSVSSEFLQKEHKKVSAFPN